MAFDFGVVIEHRDVLLACLWTTLCLAFLSILLGTMAGVIIALAKRNQNRWVRMAVTAYVDFFRLMPALLLLLWVYYALPILAGIRLDGFLVTVIVLGLALSAYVGELVFSGLAAIPRGQIESARMLGLSETQILWRITLPQVGRQLVTPLMGLYIESAKNTTFAAILALNELLHAGQVLSSIYYRPLEFYTAIAIAFLAVLWPLAWLGRKFEYASFVNKVRRTNE